VEPHVQTKDLTQNEVIETFVKVLSDTMSYGHELIASNSPGKHAGFLMVLIVRNFSLRKEVSPYPIAGNDLSV
jgi:hypothetical protein